MAIYQGLKGIILRKGLIKEMDIKIFRSVDEAREWLKRNKGSTYFGF